MTEKQADPNIFKLTASDGQTIEVSLFVPLPEASNRKVCLVAPALAVPRRFYDSFARYLASQGFHVLSFDFRGFGGSAKKPLYFEDGFKSFGRDLDAVIAEAVQYGGDIVFVGHSLGTVALGYAASNTQISRAIALGSGSGYYGWSAFPENAVRYVFWTAILPTLTRTLGFYPGRAIGILGNIPKPIALTWAQMCKNPGYLKASLADEPPQHFSNVTAPLLAISVADDKIMPRAATEELCRNFPFAQVERFHLKPQDLRLERLGHFNAFKKSQNVLWPAMARWLDGESFALMHLQEKPKVADPMPTPTPQPEPQPEPMEPEPAPAPVHEPETENPPPEVPPTPPPVQEPERDAASQAEPDQPKPEKQYVSQT